MSDSRHISPPKLPLKFLKWFCHPDMIEDVEGDVLELFTRRRKNGKLKANILFVVDVLLMLRPGMIKNFETKRGLINIAMLRNYIRVALRSALRYKGFTALNLLGLVVGMASSILILLWVNDEMQMDKFHENGDDIFQLFRNMRQTGGIVNTTFTLPKPAADLIREEYPEVKSLALRGWLVDTNFQKGEQEFEENGHFVSPEFLSMFSFPLTFGEKSTALAEMNSVVISERMAMRFFGEEWKKDALGASLTIEEEGDVFVTGVFKEPGSNSSLQFDWLRPASYFVSKNNWVNDWGNGSFGVYITLHDPNDLEAVSDRVLNEINDHAVGNNMVGDEQLLLHKFEDYYLYSNWENGVISGGRIDYVRMMSIVAFLILLIACINFMNLATARSGRRSKEIGLRKVMGAYKTSISLQFYLEAVVLSAISVICSVLVVMALLPYYNELVDKSLSLDFSSMQTWYLLLGLVFTVGLVSGSYPALLLPTFNIIHSLKGSVKQSVGADFFRKSLVVFQFAISTFLIIGMSTVYKQINFMLDKDLGLDKENVIAIRMYGDLPLRQNTYKTELFKIPQVKAITAVSGNPIDYGRSTSSANWEGKDPNEGYEINIMLTDENIVQAMGMEMVAGRPFEEQSRDSTNFVINEVAAELMGFDDPIGKKLSFWGINGRIVGVVKNFHMRNMHEPISPLILTCIDLRGAHLALVRLEENSNEVISQIEQVTKELNPGFDFRYEFVDQAYAESYRTEETLSLLIAIFASISIFISSLGLFGLTAFATERRSREIGIRKVHGASVPQILFLLTKDYTKLMLIAFLLAIPFGYFITTNWLQDFEFRTNLDPFIFIMAGILTFVVGVVTVSAKSYHAATVNPVDSLKDE